MKNALIGYTGFVGNNLVAQYDFSHKYNSKNIMDIEGESFDLVVCAGVSAVKWLANKEPQKDQQNIQTLQKALSSISAKKFILISTIDVYPVTHTHNENFDCHKMDNHAYGKHRLAFEDFCIEHFGINEPNKGCIIRLPGLFGQGLKKNVIFDLLNDNCLEMINPSSSFQYYDLSNLWSDIQTVLANGINLINFFSEPLPTQMILERYFPDKKVGDQPAPEMHYDLRTQYGQIRGRNSHYFYSKEEVMAQLEKFFNDYKGGK